MTNISHYGGKEWLRESPYSTKKNGGLSALKRNFSHPFKTYKEQLEILTNEKKLNVDTEDEAILAITALQHYSYYTLVNGYKDLFLDTNAQNGKEIFVKGTTFSMLYQAHWMDTSLSSILFKYTLLVEKKLKTRLAYLLGDIYKEHEDDYLRKNIYSPNKNHRGKLNEVIEAINKKKSKDISAIHYMENEGNLPPWIATKAVSFGIVILWYDILTPQHKLKIIKEFLVPCPNSKPEILIDYFNRLIRQVYEFRNLSAHGNRSFKLKIPDKYRLLFSHLEISGIEPFFNKNNRDNLYSVIMSILILLDDQFAVMNFGKELSAFFSIYEDDDFNFNGNDIYDLFDLPKNFRKILQQFIESKTYRSTFRL